MHQSIKQTIGSDSGIYIIIGFNTGIYFVKLTTDNKVITNKIFIE